MMPEWSLGLLFRGFNRLNWNVRYLLMASLFGSMAMNIYFGIVFSVFVKAIVGSNYELGIISSIVGIIGLSGSLLGGWLADHWRRDILIKGSLFFVTIFVILFAIFAVDWVSLVVLLSPINFFLAFGMPARQALLADSIPQGERSRIFSYFFAIQSGGGIFSPMLSIIVAFFLNDVWTMEFLRSMILLIALLTSFAFGVTLKVKDELSIESPFKETQQLKNNVSSAEIKKNHAEKEASQHEVFKSNVKYLAVIIVSSFLIGFGAGITVRFFQIFFVEYYHVKPIAWSIIFILTSLSTASSGIILQKISKKLGRVLSIVLSQGIAIVCLLLMATFPPFLFLVVFFLLRNSLMNAPAPISQSIVMDLVPPRYRGKWIAIESIAWGLFNSTAAMIGGYIIDTHGFQAVFLFTASIYTIATIILVPLIPKIPEEKNNDSQGTSF